MKKMMMALAALCVAGAASAVTFDWDYTQQIVTGATNYGAPAPGALPAWAVSTSTNTVVYGVTVGNMARPAGSSNNRVVWGLFNGNAAGAQGISLTVDETGALKLFSGGDVTGGGATQMGSNSYGTRANTAYSFVVEVVRTEGKVTVNVYNSATDLTTPVLTGSVASGFMADDLDYMAIYKAPGSGNGYGPGEDITGYAPLPEPTALALLALGVAGLALRRKAA